VDYQARLKAIDPSHKYFIGIDSDGCVFDSMEMTPGHANACPAP